MSAPHLTPPEPLPRVSTGMAGLDQVTGGGLLRSGVYILQGSPGAGKTILANQICYHHAASGGDVVYVTLLAESHARMLQHLQSFAFFDAAAVPRSVYYVSAFDALRSGGLGGVVKLLQGEMRARRAGLLVLDGLVLAAHAASSSEELKLFVSDIQAHATLSGCTTLLLTSDSAEHAVTAEQTMVDGILLLRERAFGPRRERNLEVVKFRGSRTLRGNHTFVIGPEGIVVYPRLEAARRDPSGDAVLPEGLSTGVGGLDSMFDIGGYARGSITSLVGPSGSGKTTLALHYLAHASAKEPGLFFGFYESPELLRRVARQLGIDPQGVLGSPAVRFLWQPLGETPLDEMATRLLSAVAETGARRVVIDGIGAIIASPGYEERGPSFLAALANELRRLGATTLMTLEQTESRPDLPLQMATMSAVADAIVRVRVVEEAAVRRYLMIGKSRVSRCDLRVREIALGARGVEVLLE